MDPHCSSLVLEGFPSGLSISDSHPIKRIQYDYPITGTFDFGSKPGGVLLPGAVSENLPNLTPAFCHGHTLPVRRLRIPYIWGPNQYLEQTPQQSAGPAPLLNLAWGDANVYLICPTPTTLPHVPTFQPGNLTMANHPFLFCVARRNQPAPRCCSHINCRPPSDVGFLSRRFEENEHWIRGRALAVASSTQTKRGIHFLPVEIIEMIPEYFLTVEQLTSWGEGRVLMRDWDRRKAFTVLAETCTRFKRFFYVRSRMTTVASAKNFPELVGFFKVPRKSAYGLFIERLVVQLPDPPYTSLRDCLMALPCLHTLCITKGPIVTCEIKEAFKYKPDFPGIKTLAIPMSAHPILARLPKVEEFIYFTYPVRSSRVVLKSFRGPYIRERNGDVDPVLKSFTIIALSLEQKFYTNLVEKFPRLRKVLLPTPPEGVMEELRGFKEIIEFEILVSSKTDPGTTQNLDPIKSKAIEILQASECHKDCVCEFQCGCTKTNCCFKCKPPKRFFRIKTCPSFGDSPCTGAAEGVICLEEIEVAPRRVVSKK